MSSFPKITAPLLVVFSWSFTTLAAATGEAAGIRALISSEFDRPGAAVISDPVVVENKYAVADWIQGENGGRALLRKNSGKWNIILCSGVGVRQAEYMARAGVPSAIASALAAKLADAESRLPPSRVEIFDRYGEAGARKN